MSSAGLTTQVQPAASAGAALRPNMAMGKFQGVISAATPTWPHRAKASTSKLGNNMALASHVRFSRLRNAILTSINLQFYISIQSCIVEERNSLNESVSIMGTQNPTQMGPTVRKGPGLDRNPVKPGKKPTGSRTVRRRLPSTGAGMWSP